MNRVAVLFSAGVESSSLLVYYLKKGFITTPIYVRCGFQWEEVELIWAGKLWAGLKRKYPNLRPIRTVHTRGIGPSNGSIEMPLRNFLLVSSSLVESIRRNIHTLAIGSLGIYPFPDNNREFFSNFESLLSEVANVDMKIETPFMGLEKWEVIRNFSGYLSYRLTFSCMYPSGHEHCGQCSKCMERKEGFLKAGVPDPTRYLS